VIIREQQPGIPGLSFTALTDAGVVGHVTASKATVATDPVVAVGPMGVLPELQGAGIGSAGAGWGDAFQVRPLTAYTKSVAGPFQYAPAFGALS
jgi:putative acetyltransferase